MFLVLAVISMSQTRKTNGRQVSPERINDVFLLGTIPIAPEDLPYASDIPLTNHIGKREFRYLPNESVVMNLCGTGGYNLSGSPS